MFKKVKKFLKRKEVQNFKNKAGKLAGDLKDNAKEDFAEIKEEAKETISEVRETVSEKAGDLKEKVGDIAESVKEKAEDVKEKVEDKIDVLKGDTISFDTFLKMEVKVGEILSVEKIEKSDKLLLLKVDVGEDENRQIVSGIATYFEDPISELEGKQAMFVTNLEPRKIFGYESNGMIFALNDKESFSIISPNVKIENGTKAG